MTVLRRLAGLAGLASVALVAGCSVFGGKAAPEPDHRVEAADGDFQIRAYPALTVAVTAAPGDWDDAVGTGFGRLFDYISGANAGSREIAMTAPVVTEREGEKIAMTAPVVTGRSGDGWRTAFVLPADMTAATAPAPTDPAVAIETVPARRVGAVTFSGVLDGEDVTRQRDRLAAWLGAQGEMPAGDWQMAGYNPPWTIPWLRRNEVWVTLR